MSPRSMHPLSLASWICGGWDSEIGVIRILKVVLFLKWRIKKKIRKWNISFNNQKRGVSWLLKWLLQWRKGGKWRRTRVPEIEIFPLTSPPFGISTWAGQSWSSWKSLGQLFFFAWINPLSSSDQLSFYSFSFTLINSYSRPPLATVHAMSEWASSYSNQSLHAWIVILIPQPFDRGDSEGPIPLPSQFQY